MRVGLVGTESDHAEDFLRLLNQQERHPGWRIAAIWGEERWKADSLTFGFGVDQVVDHPEDMAGDVDAALIVTRDGRRHVWDAKPFLDRDQPVFVDKPLACSVVHAESILAFARPNATLVLSASALRWQPDTEALAARIEALGGARSITATGTFDPDSEYGGSFFYGIHPTELALQLAGPGPVEDIFAERTADGVSIRCRVGEIAVTVNLVPPLDGKVVFHAAATCRDGMAESRIGLGDEYMAPVLDRFVAMAQRGRPLLQERELVAPIRLLEAAEAALRSGR